MAGEGTHATRERLDVGATGGMTALRIITGITYRRGPLDPRDPSPERLPSCTLGPAEIPREVLGLIMRLGLLDLGGTYGDPRVGDPVEYDHLLIHHSQGETDITVFNRGIILFITDDETIRRIHQVCCELERLREAGPSI